MRLLAVLALLACSGCAVLVPEWHANQQKARAVEAANPGLDCHHNGQGVVCRRDAPDSALQDYANFMSVVQGMRGPQMNPADVLFMQPRQYPPLPYRTCRPPYC